MNSGRERRGREPYWLAVELTRREMTGTSPRAGAANTGPGGGRKCPEGSPQPWLAVDPTQGPGGSRMTPWFGLEQLGGSDTVS